MRIVFLDSGTFGRNAPMEKVRTLGEVQFFEQTMPEQITGRIAEAHVVVTNKVRLNSEHLKSATSLQLVVVTATVADIIDLATAQERQITVETTAGYSTESVAQMTMTLMLMLMTRINFYTEYVESGLYSEQPFFSHVGAGYPELHGKQIGVIGLGRIGTRVAELGTAFGANVVYYSTTGENFSTRFPRVGLEALLTRSDVVTIHAPRTIRTYNLINKVAFDLMRDTTILINTGRGGIVDEVELVDAILTRSIAGAALDVFEQEPLPMDSPLRRLTDTGRLILTPHCAWGSDNAQQALAQKVYDAIARFTTLKAGAIQ